MKQEGFPGRLRVLVVEPDPSRRKVLRAGLESRGHMVSVARDGVEALRHVGESRPDVVVLATVAPGEDGQEVCRTIRAESGDACVLVFPAEGFGADEVLWLDAGADEYMIGPISLERLDARIRALARRCRREAVGALRFADLELDTAARVAMRGDREIHLTATEFRLLREFLARPGHVLSKDELITRVWDPEFGGRSNVVEVYVRYLREKLEADGRPRLIHTLRNSGYVLRETAP